MHWFAQLVDWSSKNNHVVYGIVVVVTMAGVGTALGLLTDWILRLTGLKFDKYTDDHVNK
jgi:hypothetical protein